jgi:hypothetical protein
MDVSGQPHASTTLYLGKEPLEPTEQEAGWAPEPIWTFMENGKTYGPARI